MTTPAAAGPGDRSAALFGTAAMLCFVYVAVVLLVLHALRPDYAPAHHMISDYAVGPYGWLMQSAFIGMSVGCVVLAVALARHGPATGTARLAVALLSVASVGLLVSAIFPTDLLGAARTRSGRIHTVSFLVNISSIVLAIALLTASSGRDRRWRTYQRTSAVLLCLTVLAFVLQFLTLRKGAPYGLANRLFICVLSAWFIATAQRVRSLAREQSS